MNLTKFKNYLLNCILIVVSFAFSWVLLEFGLRSFYNSSRDYPSNQEILLYDSLAPLNHHIRGFDKAKLQDGKQYYSVYKSDNTQAKHRVIVFQGDSWAELLDQTNLSKLMLGVTEVFINGGTSSYSPSLMEVQLNDIVAETGFVPSSIVAYIDQTDFMDEACDYNRFRVTSKDQKLVSLRKPSGQFEERYKLRNSFTAFNSMEFKSLFFIWNRLNNIINNKLSHSSPVNCKWEDIKKFMEGTHNINDEEIFRKNIISYLTKALEMTSDVKLLTHRHRGHFDERYSNDIFSSIEKILNEHSLSDRVSLIDLSGGIGDIELIFPSDKDYPASHPYMDYYRTVLSEKIYRLYDQ